MTFKLDHLYDSNSISIDVITITSKIDNTLFTTLNNVSQQTYRNINHLIIYRQATNVELAKLENFDHHKNLSFYPETGKGIAAAFNDGIKHGQGRLVLFLNSGDTLVANNVIDRVAQSYGQNNWLWATGETISVSKRRFLKKHSKQRQTWSNNLFWYGNPVCHQSTFYSRKLIEQIGLYSESLSIGMDYDYNVRASQVSPPTLLYFPIAYYDTTGLSSVRVFKQFTNYRRLRDRYFELSTFNRFKIDLYSLTKSIYRLAMVPAKLWL